MPSPAVIRGFLVSGGEQQEQGAVVMWLWGRGDDGRTFAVRDTRFVPYFHVPRAEAHRVPVGGSVRVVPGDRRALHGGPVVRVEGRHLGELRAARDTLRASGVACYEADLRPLSRYLIDRGLRGAMVIEGRARPAPASWSVDRIFDDPLLSPLADGEVPPPPLALLSIDIETTPGADRVLSVALHGPAPFADEVLLLSDGPAPAGATAFADERGLLAAVVASVRRRDPDILTGWNVIDFDLAVLLARCRARGLRLALGRDGSEPRLQSTRSFFGTSTASIGGRVVLDGIALLRGSFVQLDEYGLDFVARRFLGEGKTIGQGEAADSSSSRVDEIQRLYRDEPARFVEYNLRDAQLVPRILDRLGLVGLAMQRSTLTGMPLDRVAASIASFDSLYLPELRARGLVAPSVDDEAGADEPQQGGLVLASQPGLYRDVFVFDFKSLYPSVIRTFQIDPLGHVTPGDGEAATVDTIEAPGGARFRRQGAILPAILDRLFPRREAAKRAGDEVGSHAIKILMNSLYGVLGASACRFYDAELANAITGFGREILLWTKARIEAGGRRVLYGDTDSLFVLAAPSDVPPEERGRELLARLNEELAAWVRERWRVESRLELEFDTLYARLHLPTMRQSAEGARKRYAGLAVSGGAPRVEFTGMEAVRRDGTELGRTVQRELYERLFHDREVVGYLKEVVARLRSGELDELLVYRKALRKPLDSYTASTPPHVAAARRMAAPVGRIITYVITTAGPEPVSERRHPLDRAHYLDKQLRPVAEPVLELLGLDFDAVLDRPVQLRLF